jgi:hypothetical protein
LPIKKRIAVVNQTAGNDIVVRVFEKTGPVEVEIQEVLIKDHAPIFVEGAKTVTRIIEPGKPVKIGKHSTVGVVSVRRYIPESVSAPSLPHRAVVFQTK